MSHYLDLVMIPAQLVIAFFTVYYFIIAVAGMWHRKEKNLAAPKNKFAIVIPAHNERMVVGDLLDNLKLLKYNIFDYTVFFLHVFLLAAIR